MICSDSYSSPLYVKTTVKMVSKFHSKDLTQALLKTFRTSVSDIKLAQRFDSLVLTESHPRTFSSKQVPVTETALVLHIHPTLIKMPQPAKVILFKIFN